MDDLVVVTTLKDLLGELGPGAVPDSGPGGRGSAVGAGESSDAHRRKRSSRDISSNISIERPGDGVAASSAERALLDALETLASSGASLAMIEEELAALKEDGDARAESMAALSKVLAGMSFPVQKLVLLGFDSSLWAPLINITADDLTPGFPFTQRQLEALWDMSVGLGLEQSHAHELLEVALQPLPLIKDSWAPVLALIALEKFDYYEVSSDLLLLDIADLDIQQCVYRMLRGLGRDAATLIHWFALDHSYVDNMLLQVLEDVGAAESSAEGFTAVAGVFEEVLRYVPQSAVPAALAHLLRMHGVDLYSIQTALAIASSSQVNLDRIPKTLDIDCSKPRREMSATTLTALRKVLADFPPLNAAFSALYNGGCLSRSHASSIMSGTAGASGNGATLLVVCIVLALLAAATLSVNTGNGRSGHSQRRSGAGKHGASARWRPRKTRSGSGRLDAPGGQNDGLAGTVISALAWFRDGVLELGVATAGAALSLLTLSGVGGAAPTGATDGASASAADKKAPSGGSSAAATSTSSNIKGKKDASQKPASRANAASSDEESSRAAGYKSGGSTSTTVNRKGGKQKRADDPKKKEEERKRDERRKQERQRKKEEARKREGERARRLEANLAEKTRLERLRREEEQRQSEAELAEDRAREERRQKRKEDEERRRQARKKQRQADERQKDAEAAGRRDAKHDKDSRQQKQQQQKQQQQKQHQLDDAPTTRERPMVDKQRGQNGEQSQTSKASAAASKATGASKSKRSRRGKDPAQPGTRDDGKALMPGSADDAKSQTTTQAQSKPGGKKKAQKDRSAAATSVALPDWDSGYSNAASEGTALPAWPAMPGGSEDWPEDDASAGPEDALAFPSAQAETDEWESGPIVGAGTAPLGWGDVPQGEGDNVEKSLAPLSLGLSKSDHEWLKSLKRRQKKQDQQRSKPPPSSIVGASAQPNTDAAAAAAKPDWAPSVGDKDPWDTPIKVPPPRAATSSSSFKSGLGSVSNLISQMRVPARLRSRLGLGTPPTSREAKEDSDAGASAL